MSRGYTPSEHRRALNLLAQAMDESPIVTPETLSPWAKADRKRRGIQDRTCPECGSLMDFEPEDEGEPPTWDCPAGGAPRHPARWWCLNEECGHEENADQEDEP